MNGSTTAKENYVEVEIEIVYEEKMKASTYTVDDEGRRNYEMDSLKHTGKVFIPKERIINTFIEHELKKKGGNYLKLELKDKKNKIKLETLLNCLEFFMNKDFQFNYSKENLISYFYAFSIFQLHDKRKEILDRLLKDLTDENVIHFLHVVSTLHDEFLSSYAFWLVRYLINRSEKISGSIVLRDYDYDDIVKIQQGKFSFDEEKIIFKNQKDNVEYSVNLASLTEYYECYNQINKKFFVANNHFNVGKILRRKTDTIFGDYPHYYQLVLENDPSLELFAMRNSENSNFILSRSMVRIPFRFLIGRFY